MSEFKLDVRGLTKRYGAVTALASADLSVREGEFVTLLGPSGSGKTTLLSIVAGLNEPTAGEVWIDGRVSTHLPPYERDLGMVFQSYALFPHMTVAENISFPLKMRRKHRGSDVSRKVHAVLEAVRLPEVENRMPAELSGGQQQRVALARCMVYEPSIILMDEPLGALDKNLREELQLEIKALHVRHGITVLYVTHDQQEAMTMSDRICLMNSARIEQIGTPEELYSRPASVFAARFFGESNMFRGHITECGPLTGVASESGVFFSSVALPGLKKGEAVTAMVRPERTFISTTGREGNANVLRGTVEQVIFVGGVTKYYVRSAAGVPLVAVRLTDPGRPSASVGQEVEIGWNEADMMVLRD